MLLKRATSGVRATYVGLRRRMDKVIANRVCEKCGTVMFERGIDLDFGKVMAGWSCTECNTTVWEEIV